MKAEAENAGVIAYNEYMQIGRSFKPKIYHYRLFGLLDERILCG